jgi:peptidoglycan/xylan/chitin deacetylase (PgdA/CDA1 family)
MKVALTIDTEQRSRPADTANPRRQLDLLAAEGVRATFFVQGRWASACPDVARRIGEEGHLLGNHTYHHVRLTLMTDQGIRHTVLRAEEVIVQRTRARLRPWFRCPYGDGEDDPRVLATLRDVGYENVGWDVDPKDWRPDRHVDEVVEAVLAGCREAGDGTHDEVRVLLHSWPDATAAALPGIVAGLRAAGAELVRLDELADPAAPGRVKESDEVDGVDR